MGIFKIFKAAPVVEEIKDKKVVKKLFSYWRIRVFYSMYFGYALYYFSRKSLNAALPFLKDDLGLDKTQLGMFITLLSFTYGVSKFVSGVLSDKSNPKYFMGICLIITGICNIFFGLSSTMLFFAIFWGLNGWFQGGGWPPCGKLLTHWYSQSERGRWWSIWNTSHNVGGFLIPYIVVFLAAHWGWRYGMYVPGILCILGGIVLINRLSDVPRSLGLPTIEKYKNDYPDEKKHEEVSLSTKEILFKYVLSNKYIWILGISYFFIYTVRMGIDYWGVLLLSEGKAYPEIYGASGMAKAAFVYCFFEVGGFLGSIAAGWSSDFFFRGRRGPVNAIFAFFTLLVVFAFWKGPAIFYIDAVLMFLIGFFIFGPQMLIGVAAAELSHKKAAGTSTGFIGVIAYVGAATAGVPLGKVTDVFGWNGYFLLLIICAAISILFLSTLWGVKSRA